MECKKMLPTKAAPIASLNLSIIHWSLSRNTNRNKTPCSKLNLVQSTRSKILNWRAVIGKGVCSDSNKQHSNFKWQRAKAWKWWLAWFWIDHNQSLQPNWSQMNCYVWKPSSDQHWQESQDKLWFSIWSFFEQSAIGHNHLLCYWPTIYNSILKVCAQFQVLSSHFFKVHELLDEQWAKIVQSEKISTPIYVECDKMYLSKVWVQEFWYIVPGLDIQPEQS